MMRALGLQICSHACLCYTAERVCTTLIADIVVYEEFSRQHVCCMRHAHTCALRVWPYQASPRTGASFRMRLSSFGIRWGVSVFVKRGFLNMICGLALELPVYQQCVAESSAACVASD